MKNVNKTSLPNQVIDKAKTCVVVTIAAVASILSSCDKTPKGKHEITFVVFYDESSRDTITLEANDRYFEIQTERGVSEIKTYGCGKAISDGETVFETTAPIKVLEIK